ncbi:hypothetical protein [Tsukamurella soli]|uniref:DUF5642 domain-containing protein n=1 Tax=Tsukamurella soli TaxID=644556 RepID=A0ABP8J3Q5_9ACTN
MRHNNAARSAGVAVAAAATFALAACGSGATGSSGATATSSAVAPPVPAAKALTAADLPSDWKLAAVPGKAFVPSAIGELESSRGLTYEPAACKAPDIAGQSEVEQTATASQRVEITVSNAVYSVALLPGDVDIRTFESAATGQCAKVTLSNGTASAQRITTKQPLPSGIDVPGGFVLDATTIPVSGGGQPAHGLAAYLTTHGTTVIVSSAVGASGTVDRVTFDDVLDRVVKKVSG